MCHEIIHRSIYTILIIILIKYFRSFCTNLICLLKHIANKKRQIFFQAPESFYRVRSWLSTAVVALTRVQRVEGNRAEVSERGKHRSSSTSSPPRRRELHAACLCLDEPVSRTVTSGSLWPPSARSPALSPRTSSS